MGLIEEVGTQLQEIQSILPIDLLAQTVEKLDNVEDQYKRLLPINNTETSSDIFGGLENARQAIREANEALQRVSTATIGCLALLGYSQAAQESQTASFQMPKGEEKSISPKPLPTFETLNNGPHVVARTDINAKLRDKAKAESGVDLLRAQVIDDQIDWAQSAADYAPPFIDIPNTYPGDNPHPADPKSIESFTSISGKSITRETDGRPQNPAGRTGLAGRGILSQWGENPAADLIITRTNPENGELEVVAIQRQDTGEWALPGGKVDDGESPDATALREFYEEAGGRDYNESPDDDDPWKLDMSKARTIYAGYIDDSRNTDNAWMASTVFHRHLTAEEVARMRLQANTDARDVKWAPVNSRFFASHGRLVELAVQLRQQDQA